VKYHDLTLPLNENTLLVPIGYDGGGFHSEQISGDDEGGGVVHQISQNTHTGTHMDSPAHYIKNGTPIDQLNKNLFTGEAKIVDLRDHAGEMITAEVLANNQQDIGEDDRVVLITGDVDAYFHGPKDPELRTVFENASAISVDGAKWLVEQGVSLIANDFLTESLNISNNKPYNPERPVHHTLLGSGIPIVEYLCNTGSIVSYDTVEFTCFPLPLTGLDASPARVLANID